MEEAVTTPCFEALTLFFNTMKPFFLKYKVNPSQKADAGICLSLQLTVLLFLHHNTNTCRKFWHIRLFFLCIHWHYFLNISASLPVQSHDRGCDPARAFRDRAVIACSLIFATKKLSTMLYSEFTSIDSTIGIAIDARSGRIGFFFIKVLFILFSFLCFITTKNATQLSLHCCMIIVRRKEFLFVTRLKNPHQFWCDKHIIIYFPLSRLLSILL